MSTFRWQILVLCLVAIFGVGTALALSLRTPPILQYEKEWVTALLQAGLIAVLGVVSSSVLESFKDGLQRRRDESKLLFDALEDLGRIYMDVKLIRRKAQASKSLDQSDIPELNQRQVRIELHRDNSNLFSRSDELSHALSKMEKYLNRVANKPDSPERADFLLTIEGFKPFSEAYHLSSALMRCDIGARQSPSGQA